MSSPSPAPSGPSARPFRRAAVLGAGVMGSQIAALLAGVGLEVDLLDLSAEGDDRSAPARRSLKATTKLKPDPFYSVADRARVRVGNLDDHLDRLATADLVVEVVVEDTAIKRALLERVEAAVGEHTIVATNTSGLPVASLSEGRGESFRRRFLGVHFFNPPRYLRLLELIPTDDTDPDVLEAITRFGRLHLGKGVVVAKDTPNFIGNRIGTYAVLSLMRRVTDGEYTIEEVDALTGKLVGRAKSATFRTADLVGLDVLEKVAHNLHEAVPLDESREVFRPPWLLTKLVERESLGAKTKRGFYAKVGGEILSVDPETMEYRKPRAMKLGGLDDLKAIKPLAERLRKLYEDDGRAGAFFKSTTLEVLGYAARRLPEIADEIVDVDRAMEWGFGWQMGPFAMWDALGFARVLADMREARIKLPEWIDAMEASGAAGFYAADEASESSWSQPQGALVSRPRAADALDLPALAADDGKLIWSNEEAALIDIGEGVALYQFRSKMNALGRAVVEGVFEAIDLVEQGPWHGLVIGNAAEHFTVGANLFEVATAAVQGHWDELDHGIARFQGMGQRIRYATKPVVVATQGRVLGGGCEMTMWCPNPVVSVESYIGLVEIGVGLIPAGGGTTLMTALAAERAVDHEPRNIAPHLRAAFEIVAKADVATSAQSAMEKGFVAPTGVMVMNPDRRLWVARQRVLELAAQGYRPPGVRAAIPVLGPTGRGPFDVGLQHLVEGGHVDPWLAHVAGRIGWVMTGGDIAAPATLHEDRMLELERDVFLTLLGEKKTQQKIAEILTANQPKVAKVLAKGLVNITSVFRRKPKKGSS